MTEAERLADYREKMLDRKKQRDLEGVHKWPYMVEEPVTDEDWEHFNRYVDDHINGVENPAQWPPAYWDDYDDPEDDIEDGDDE